MIRFQLDIRRVVATSGVPCLVLGLAQLFPALVALTQPHGHAGALFLGALASCATGLLLRRLRPDFSQTGKRPLTRRESLAVVALSWLAAVACASLPYLLATPATIPDCLVESASGLTTVGATVFPDVDAIPPSLHLWRALTHWLGGAGIVLVVLIAIPWLGQGSDLAVSQKREASFLTERYRGSTRNTLQGLVLVYTGATLTQTLLMIVLGVSPWEALLHAFATISTGGFSTRTASMGAWGNLVQLVTLGFMVLGALSFATLGKAMDELWRRARDAHGRGGLPGAVAATIGEGPPVLARSLWRDTEIRGYLKMLALVSLVIAATLYVSADAQRAGRYEGWGGAGQALVDAAFTVGAVSTTTGFCTEDYTQWHPLAQVILLGLMVVGGCSGSTAGGLKFRRVQILLRLPLREARRVANPKAVIPIRIGSQHVPEEQVHEATRYLGVYVLIVFACALIVGLTGSDLTSATAGAISAMGSIGPGFGDCSPTGSFQPYAQSAKLVLVLTMLMGRLEVWTLLSVLFPSFWLRRRRPPESPGA